MHREGDLKKEVFREDEEPGILREERQTTRFHQPDGGGCPHEQADPESTVVQEKEREKGRAQGGTDRVAWPWRSCSWVLRVTPRFLLWGSMRFPCICAGKFSFSLALWHFKPPPIVWGSSPPYESCREAETPPTVLAAKAKCSLSCPSLQLERRWAVQAPPRRQPCSEPTGTTKHTHLGGWS